MKAEQLKADRYAASASRLAGHRYRLGEEGRGQLEVHISKPDHESRCNYGLTYLPAQFHQQASSVSPSETLIRHCGLGEASVINPVVTKFTHILNSWHKAIPTALTSPRATLPQSLRRRSLASSRCWCYPYLKGFSFPSLCHAADQKPPSHAIVGRPTSES